MVVKVIGINEEAHYDDQASINSSVQSGCAGSVGMKLLLDVLQCRSLPVPEWQIQICQVRKN